MAFNRIYTFRVGKIIRFERKTLSAICIRLVNVHYGFIPLNSALAAARQFLVSPPLERAL